MPPPDLDMATGDQLDLQPLATKPAIGASFFATLLPPAADLISVTALDATGEQLEPQDLSHHQAAWQRFRQRHPHPKP